MDGEEIELRGRLDGHQSGRNLVQVKRDEFIWFEESEVDVNGVLNVCGLDTNLLGPFQRLGS